MTETLNIDHHRRILLEKALEKTGSATKAAKILGISRRTVERMKARYGIKYDSITRKHEIKQTAP